MPTLREPAPSRVWPWWSKPVTGAVAVVGLGAMGSRIGARLRHAGYETVVWNRDADAARHLVQLGATAVSSPAEAAARADTVIVTVADASALVSVSEGPEGIASGTHSCAQIIVMSTVGPAAVAQLAAALPAEAEVLDAPVMGSLAEAEQGTLQIFVSGTSAAALRADPLLRTLGTPLYLGELGVGSAAKLVANYALLGVLAVLGEAVALADRLGVPREKTFDILAVTPLAGQAERRRAGLDSGRFPPRYRLALARKDTDLMLAAADVRDDGLLPLLHSVRSWLLKAESEGRGDEDYTAMLAAIIAGVGARNAD
jgi:3-hydroxyisobutyrate dehydrogenase